MHGHKQICDNVDFIIELLENVEKYKLNVVLDSSLNKDINKDTIIDIDIYENIYNMLNSTDVGNQKLAKEIIANCEYNESKPYILFLASCFDKLFTKSDNKNYRTVHQQLVNEKNSIKEWEYREDHFKIIKHILVFAEMLGLISEEEKKAGSAGSAFTAAAPTARRLCGSGAQDSSRTSRPPIRNTVGARSPSAAAAENACL